MLDINFYPRYIDSSNFRYLVIDDKVIASLIISNYPKQATFMQIIDSIPKNVEYDMSINVEKMDTGQVLKDITYSIANYSSELKTINKNQLDIDIIDKAKEDAQKLRHDIQINNEEVYKIHMVITVYIKREDGENKLFEIIKNIESSMYSKQLLVSYTNFRQLQAYISTLPLNTLKNELKATNNGCFITSSVANIFPFYTSILFDEGGILFGTNTFNQKMCNIDIFNKKYLNGNTCIFGSTGSGKSYCIKLCIIRSYIMNKKQIVFDPEGEYYSVCNKLRGNYISYTKNNDVINILDISPSHIAEYNDDFLNKKIIKVISYIERIINVDEFEKDVIYKNIEEAYNQKGINKDIKSMYTDEVESKVLIEKKIKNKNQIPSLYDIYNLITNKCNALKKSKEKEKYHDLLYKLKKEFLEKQPFLSSATNCEYLSNLIMFDVASMDSKVASNLIKYILDEVKLNLKNSLKNSFSKTIIYIDEIWKYIGSCGNYELAQEIFSMFKTIRKLNAAIFTITQDVEDFFEYQNGIYGKSILNNSEFKIIFKTEYLDTKFFKEICSSNTQLINEIYKLDKGQAIVIFKSNYIKVNIIANQTEKSIIEGGNEGEINSSFK